MATSLRLTAVDLAFADGIYRFDVGPVGIIRELQEKCGAGPYAIARRLMSGDWRDEDIRETLRLGLIGGGVSPAQSFVLVRDYVEMRPRLECSPIALAVLAAYLNGAPASTEGDDDPKPEAATTQPTG